MDLSHGFLYQLCASPRASVLTWVFSCVFFKRFFSIYLYDKPFPWSQYWRGGYDFNKPKIAGYHDACKHLWCRFLSRYTCILKLPPCFQFLLSSILYIILKRLNTLYPKGALYKFWFYKRRWRCEVTAADNRVVCICFRKVHLCPQLRWAKLTLFQLVSSIVGPAFLAVKIRKMIWKNIRKII